MVKENEPGALGKLSKPIKIWDNEGADTSGKYRVRRQPSSADVFSIPLFGRETDHLGFLSRETRGLCVPW